MGGWAGGLTNYLVSSARVICRAGCYLEDVGPEGGVRQLEDVAGPDQVEPWLVLVHRVQDRLQSDVMVRVLSPFPSASIWAKGLECRVAVEGIGLKVGSAGKGRGEGSQKASSTCELPPKRQKQTS